MNKLDMLEGYRKPSKVEKDFRSFLDRSEDYFGELIVYARAVTSTVDQYISYDYTDSDFRRLAEMFIKNGYTLTGGRLNERD